MIFFRVFESPLERRPFCKLSIRLLIPRDCVEDVDITGAKAAALAISLGWAAVDREPDQHRGST